MKSCYQLASNHHLRKPTIYTQLLICYQISRFNPQLINDISGDRFYSLLHFFLQRDMSCVTLLSNGRKKKKKKYGTWLSHNKVRSKGWYKNESFENRRISKNLTRDEATGRSVFSCSDIRDMGKPFVSYRVVTLSELCHVRCFKVTYIRRIYQVSQLFMWCWMVRTD